MSVPPISARAKTEFESSCNMRCCICLFPKRGTPRGTTQEEINKYISELARDRLAYIVEQYDKERK